MADTPKRDSTPLFNAHADECERCRTNARDLCPIGAGLLHREAPGFVKTIIAGNPTGDRDGR